MPLRWVRSAASSTRTLNVQKAQRRRPQSQNRLPLLHQQQRRRPPRRPPRQLRPLWPQRRLAEATRQAMPHRQPAKPWPMRGCLRDRFQEQGETVVF